MQHIVRYFVFLVLNRLPRPHCVNFSSAFTMITLLVCIWSPHMYFPEADQQFIYRFILDKKNYLNQSSPENSEPLDQAIPDREEYNLKDELDSGSEDNLIPHEYIISNGDTLSNILTQYGIDIGYINILAQQNPALCNLKIGQSISWVSTPDGSLQRLIWNVSRREIRTYELIGRFFKENISYRTGEWLSINLSGPIDSSFVSSAYAAGLTSNDISEVIKALQWQLDFRKLHQGDHFSVLTSREIVNGKSAQSRLLGVRFHSGGKDYYAFRAEDGKFYNLDAIGLALSFMRFPTLKQFRVSSHFNPHRLHPVTERVIPHYGVDFATPIGTPVLAVGDGEVIISKKYDYAGNCIVIRHGHQYVTRYMHLKKLLVKQGQQVKRGDIIALSGNTGRSTGPHLHYEILINHQAVNPLTAKLPNREYLTGHERDEYLSQVAQILPQLK